MLPNNAFKVWIFYFPSEIVRIILAIYGLVAIRKMSQKDKNMNAQISDIMLFKKLLIITIVLTIIITIEDTIVIFFYDTYAIGKVHMTNRSMSEDILAIIYAVIAISYFAKGLINADKSNEGEKDSSQKNNLISKSLKFAYAYNMTSRELEVLLLLVENKSNQEISEELFISMGTVKSHIHNIFAKLEVTKRSHVQKIYAEYDV
jgi:DNA-binding NarL/FixJ family response regulator